MKAVTMLILTIVIAVFAATCQRQQDSTSSVQADASKLALAREFLKRVAENPAGPATPANSHAKTQAGEYLDQLERESWEDVQTPMVVSATITQPYMWADLLRLNILVIEKARVREVLLVDDEENVVGRTDVQPLEWDVPARNIGVLLSARQRPDPYEPALLSEVEQQAGMKLPILYIDKAVIQKRLYVRVTDGVHTSQREQVFIDQIESLTQRAKDAIETLILRNSPPTESADPEVPAQPSRSVRPDLGELLEPFGKSLLISTDVRGAIAQAMLSVVADMKSDNFDRPTAPVAILEESGGSTRITWVWIESGFGVSGFWAQIGSGMLCEYPCVIDCDEAATKMGSRSWSLSGTMLRHFTLVVTRSSRDLRAYKKGTSETYKQVVCEQWECSGVTELGLICADGYRVGACKIIRFCEGE